ncbi:MAG: hypothetical protein ACJA1A_002881 [Saprospiraceae bacterium]|jgi:hypothetical protein|tara:strand:+ start:2730 stop:3014 length:285 start_codon:yes stop_codon:yes gene_type:complete
MGGHFLLVYSISLKSNRDCSSYKKFTNFNAHFTDGTMDWMAKDWIKFSNSNDEEHEIYHFDYESDTLKLYNHSMANVEDQWVVGSLQHTWIINE